MVYLTTGVSISGLRRLNNISARNMFLSVILFSLLNPKNGRVGGFLKPPGHFQPVLAMKFLVESEFQGQEPPKPPEPPEPLVPPEPPEWVLVVPVVPWR